MLATRLPVLFTLIMSMFLTGCFDSDDSKKTSGSAHGKKSFEERRLHNDRSTGEHFDVNNVYDQNGELVGSEPAPDSNPVYINSMRLQPPPRKMVPSEAGPNSRRQLYVADILRASNAYGVEVELIHAIISQESLYQANAGSNKGAKGLMQLLDSTGRRFNCTNVWNPQCNIKAGTQYLKFLAKRYDGNIQTIASGYNAGEGVADSYLNGKPLPGKNPSGIKTPNGVPLGSFSMSADQKRRCPRNNWNPTPQCEGETYKYVRRVSGFYLMYKQMPELVGKAAKTAPSVQARRQGRQT